MAQETLKSLIAVIMTLPLQEQEQVVQELQCNISMLKTNAAPTDEQKARLRMAYQEAQDGNVISQVDAHKMIEEFVPDSRLLGRKG